MPIGPPRTGSGADLEAIADRLHAAYPADYPAASGYGITATPWREVLVRNARPTLLILIGAVWLVLLVACANVGSLTMARLVRRERELAVHAALGATRGRLRRRLLGEHLVLAVLGSALGVVVAWVAHRALVDYTARLTLRADAVSLDGVVLAFSLVVGVGTAMAFAFFSPLPSADAASSALSGGSTGARSTAGRAQRRAQRWLVAAQVAVSVVVLVGAGLLVRSFANLQRVDPGFDTAQVLSLRAPNITQFPPDKNRQLFDELSAKLRTFPGVVAVSTATRAPFEASPVNAIYVKADEGRLAFSVSERTREFGIRMALGSGERQILHGVLGEGLALAAAGLAGGVIGATALARFLQTLLFDVGALDVATFVAVGVVLTLVAVGAAWLPARRATRVDPSVALRAS